MPHSLHGALRGTPRISLSVVSLIVSLGGASDAGVHQLVLVVVMRTCLGITVLGQRAEVSRRFGSYSSDSNLRFSTAPAASPSDVSCQRANEQALLHKKYAAS